MFGIRRKKANQPENQIPYEVYETLRQPAERRRIFIIRLVAALAVVTLLTFGALAISRKILGTDDNASKNSSSQSEADKQNQNDDSKSSPSPESSETEQAPQPEASNPNRNNTTVGKPE